MVTVGHCPAMPGSLVMLGFELGPLFLEGELKNHLWEGEQRKKEKKAGLLCPVLLYSLNFKMMQVFHIL